MAKTQVPCSNVGGKLHGDNNINDQTHSVWRHLCTVRYYSLDKPFGSKYNTYLDTLLVISSWDWSNEEILDTDIGSSLQNSIFRTSKSIF